MKSPKGLSSIPPRSVVVNEPIHSVNSKSYTYAYSKLSYCFFIPKQIYNCRWTKKLALESV